MGILCLQMNVLGLHSFQYVFQGNLWKLSRWFTYLFVYEFYSFHPNNFRNTKSGKCSLKNDCIGSSLMECQSFLNSKIDVDPIYRVLMSLPIFMQVLCMTRYIQVDYIRILVTSPKDQQAIRILSFSCSNFDLQVLFLN